MYQLYDLQGDAKALPMLQDFRKKNYNQFFIESQF